MSEETQETRPVNGKSMYSYIAKAWDVPSKSYVKELNYERRIMWRREENFLRIEKPTRLDRARALGYKAKQGYVIVRARVRKGSFQKRAIVTGRRAKRKGINQITVGKSLQSVTAKLLAGITVGMLETLLILLACVGTDFAISGFGGGETSVQFFVGPTDMDMKISTAFWIYTGIMLVIGLLMSVFAMCLSQVFRNSVAVIASMMVLWLISMLNPPYSWRLISQACSYLPVTFLGGWTFSDYRMVHLFGRLFTILETAPVVYLVFTAILGGLTQISYERYQVAK